MKVIDLLNKVANENFLPKAVNTRTGSISYYLYDKCGSQCDDKNLQDILNADLEIIEEKKIPEKLEILNANEHSKEVYYKNYSKEEISLDIETLQIWVNKIIDYLKNKGDE